MAYSPLSISRRHVLGDLHNRCEPIENIPVYLVDNGGEVLGHVDQSLGHYADAFSFHLPEDICKRLSSGQFGFSFDYEYCGDASLKGSNRKIKLNYICLTPLTPPVKPAIPRAAKLVEAIQEKASVE
ncbi:MAG: hypothetical protein ACR2IH_12285 [Pyrinomonadaceae bacterium]